MIEFFDREIGYGLRAASPASFAQSAFALLLSENNCLPKGRCGTSEIQTLDAA